MSLKAAIVLAAGLVIASGILSFAPLLTWQTRAEQRFEKLESRLTETTKSLEQAENTLQQVQQKLAPLKHAPPGKWRFLHETKGSQGLVDETFFEETDTGDVYLWNRTSFIKLSKKDKDKK
jgi:hypothetical protein